MSLRFKILFTILSVSAVMFFILISYIGYTTKDMTLANAEKQLKISSKAYSNEIKAKFDYQIGVTETYINAVSHLNSVPIEERKAEDKAVGFKIISSNPQIMAIWSSWLVSSYDSLRYEDYGRSFIGLYRNGENIEELDLPTIEMDGMDLHPNFVTVRSTEKPIITEPYKGVFRTGDKDSIDLISIEFPIMSNSIFYGLGGIDLNLEHFNNLINQAKLPFNNSYAFFVSNKGRIINHPVKSKIGTLINNQFKEAQTEKNILSNIQSGRQFSFNYTINNKESYVYFTPIKFEKIKEPWSIVMVIPAKEVMIRTRKEFTNILLFTSVFLLFFIIIAIWLSGTITRPLNRIRVILDKIAKGEISQVEKLKQDSTDELGKMIKSTNALVDKMNSIAKFSEQISKGNLESKYKADSQYDELGNSILEMQKNLIIATQENEKRKEEDRRINWTTTGIAKFSELLRQNSNDIEEFSYIIISNLVEYLQANQGAIFLINDKNKNNMFIEKTGAYAYSHRKYDEQTFELGVGLVGRCIMEKQTIYLTDIPDDYIRITSGLGEEVPKCLVLIPLKYNDVTYGVIEVASFTDIEKYQISFLEKIGESIASSISSIKINSQTAKLLDESQMQSEMLSSQEEEMRQNLEEMRATQEQLQDAIEQSKEKEQDLSKNNRELNSSLEAYERIMDSISYPLFYKDLKGKYLSCNQAYADVMGFDKQEIIGRTDYQFLNFEDAQAFEEEEKKLIEEKRDETKKILFTTKAGHVFNGILNKKVLYNRANRLMGTISVLLPIDILDVGKKQK